MDEIMRVLNGIVQGVELIYDYLQSMLSNIVDLLEWLPAFFRLGPMLIQFLLPPQFAGVAAVIVVIYAVKVILGADNG